ncbi:DNA-binding helix-turn-helix protein [Acetobacteraceae bacterium AT-5844]|nr:DNA-binding helix-turn-helix protein [Acetobacteraceae bacterium AT-5844]
MTLREWMAREGLSNQDMGQRLGRAANSVSRWRNGTRLPRPSDLVAIARVTGGEVTANDFFHAPRSGSIQPAQVA